MACYKSCSRSYDNDLNDDDCTCLASLFNSTFIERRWQLVKAKKATKFSDTRSGISRLITVTVESGMTVTIGASGQLLLFMIFNAKDLHFLP